ncbi:hypothetical protein [Spirosoma montaniterrae]|uniref:hypothetical protein n=1 Tax=Spirosoma montaniterrae TaxID=1178516 RepID=UPI0018DAF62F|nr:hypothetical protein [Spirosoma montaniterrae]
MKAQKFAGLAIGSLELLTVEQQATVRGGDMTARHWKCSLNNARYVSQSVCQVGCVAANNYPLTGHVFGVCRHA